MKGLSGKDEVWELDIEEVTEGGDALDPSVLKLISQQIEQLPPFPMVINQVLRVIENPNSSLADLTKVILNDPSLTGAILKTVNSAYYGFKGAISTVSHAVSLLGLKEIKSLTLSLPINDAFFSGKKRSFGLDQGDLWIHCLSVGLCGRKIAESARYAVPEEAFVAGLLHDIGKNLLNDVFPERFDHALHLARKNDQVLADVEKKMLGISHATIGAWLGQHWKLPPPLIAAIQNHHDPLAASAASGDKGVRLEAVIFLGDWLAKFLSLGFSGDRYIPLVKPKLLKHLAITAADVVSIAESVPRDIQPTLRPFGVEIDVKPITDEDKAKIAGFFASTGMPE